jgi:2-(1,2-epoxy-1,2-dihydrophenyl)acetyl-CoA isomerase
MLGEKEDLALDEVIFHQQGSVGVITLNRPQVMNAFNLDMLHAINRMLSELGQDDSIRAIVVTGEGRGFCAGADLAGGGLRSDGQTPMGMRLSTQVYSSVIKAMADIEKPVVGAINGAAAGAGCSFALSCDLLIASEEARLIMLFVRRGLVADTGGTYFLPRLIGLARAKELMFTGEEVGAYRALELGLVNRVVPHERLMEEAMEMATGLAKGPTRAIGMIKRMLNRSFQSDLDTALELEASFQGIAVSTEDVKEGLASFIEKRESDFKGR